MMVMAMKTKINDIAHLPVPSATALPNLIQPFSTPSPNNASPVSLPNILLASIKTMKPTREMIKITMLVIKLAF